MGASNSLPQTETINWKNLKTEQISDIPNLYGISAEANRLVEKINVPKLSESSSTDLDHLFLNKNDNNITYDKVSENFSSTSPFISSEMYKYVMNKYQQQNMVGGATNDLNDESETTSTSSSSESSDSSSSTPIKQKPAKGKAKGKKTKTTKKNTDAFLDYISSSAHTGGSITDNSSVANENNITVSSVRTSQINLISE
jgi:hypothetical protein